MKKQYMPEQLLQSLGLRKLYATLVRILKDAVMIQAAVLWLLHRRRKICMDGTSEQFFLPGPSLIESGVALRAGVLGGPMHEAFH